ncbi:hypothetical protein ACU8KI_16090 [Rhizobium leguminosarum]
MQYLIDINTVTTFWVTATSEEKALEALKNATRALELRIWIGGKKQPIELVDLSWREDEPLLIEEYDD